MNAVSSLSLALPVPNIPFSSSLSFVLSSFLASSVSVSPFLSRPSLSLLSCSALDSRNPFISRSRFRGSVPFFPLPTYMFAFPRPPSPAGTSPLFRRPLRARFSGFSPALCSDRLRIHCEIDRPKRVPEWPERTRMQQKRMGWHMRSGRFKGKPQERDTTATQLHSDPVKLVIFF